MLGSSAAGERFRSMRRTRETNTERRHCRWHPWKRWRTAFGSVVDVGDLVPVWSRGEQAVKGLEVRVASIVEILF